MRGALAGLPDSLTVLRGVGNLLRVRAGLTLSLGAVLESRARRDPDLVALKFGEREWTYAEFNGWVNRHAHAFARAGVRHGDVVALLMENHAAGLACVAALAKLGAIAGMLNPNLRGDALRHSLAAMKPARVVVAGECVEAYRELQNGGLENRGQSPVSPKAPDAPRSPEKPGSDPGFPAPFWLPGHEGGRCPEGWTDLEAGCAKSRTVNPASTSKVAPEQPLCYILTSGTTGMPKASVMSHRRWLQSMAGMGQLALRLRPDDVLYCALPLYHNNALTVSWGATLGTGAALALDRKFSASRFWDRVRHYRATGFSYIGELCRYLLAQPESPRDRDHRVRVCIGNGLRPDIWQRFKTRFGVERVCEFYGASEGNLVFVNSFNADATAGFCPLSYAIVECDADTAQPTRDASGRLTRIPKGGVGLLISEVTEGAPFDGYTDPQAGNAKLIRDAFADGDCWFNTGDLVRDQGWHHIQFVDRLGDTFRWKGENVSTTEVEAVVRATPGIADATVYGVQVPQADGRAGTAAVQLEPGATLDGRALAQRCIEQLPAYAVPVFVRVVGALETTATFKTRKQSLKEQGADPGKVADPLFVLKDRAAGYEPLTAATWQDIAEGRTKL